MKRLFETTKQIELDAAHRVTYHDSKCRNIHGHRYKVEATVRGELFTEGSSEGMVLDFSVIKRTMMEFIHDNCDHAFIAWWRDPLLNTLLGEVGEEETMKQFPIISDVTKYGGAVYNGPLGKMYLVNFIPTAEKLAEHWYDLIAGRIAMRSDEQAKLVRLRVWETPTSYCDYPVEGTSVHNITNEFKNCTEDVAKAVIKQLDQRSRFERGALQFPSLKEPRS